jgi:mono/diheme cytochrome c family protein
MRNHSKKFLALSVLLLATTSALAQDTLPPGPGMEETVQACTACHSVGTFSNLRRPGPVWEVTLLNMIGWGAQLGGDQFDTVLEYLTTYMGTRPPPPATPAPAPTPAPPAR